MTTLKFSCDSLHEVGAWHAAMEPGIEPNPLRKQFWAEVIQLAKKIEVEVNAGVASLDRKSNGKIKTVMTREKVKFGVSDIFNNPTIKSVEAPPWIYQGSNLDVVVDEKP